MVPGTNCSSAFIKYAAQFGETIQQLFDSDQGLFGVMSYFEQQGIGNTQDKQVWAALDWTFINRWNLSDFDRAWFYGPGNEPATLAGTVTTGATRSQVFTKDGMLTTGFTAALLSVLNSPASSNECGGLARAFDVAAGVLVAQKDIVIKGVAPIPNPFPSAFAFGSNGAVPTHGRTVLQPAVGTIIDGKNTWVFYTDIYRQPKPVRRPGPR